MSQVTKRKYDYRLDEVQEAGNLLLRTTISDLRNTLTDIFWIPRSEEDQNDKGIDFQYELENKLTGESLHIFKIQNKGTETNLTPLKGTDYKGYISFQLKLRNAIYYRREIPVALIFTVSDVKSGKVFWHSVQLDDEIDERIENAIKGKTKSVQIYIDPKNVLNKDNVERFLKDVHDSYCQQVDRFKLYASDSKFFSISASNAQVDKSKPIIEQLNDVFKSVFNNLNIVPIHLLKNIYPLKKADDFYTYYSLFTLTTDNDELFELFESLKIENGKVSTTNNKFKKGVKESNKKLKYILEKLSGHLIFNVQHKKSHKTVNIRYSHEKSCTCTRCSFGRLNYEATFNGLLKRPKKIEDKMLLAYMHYELGNFVESTKLFEDIANHAKKNKQVVRYTISQFNLSKLYVFIRNNYWGENSQPELIKRLKIIETDKLYCEFKKDENKKLLDWILNSKFYSSKREEISKTVNKIKDHYHTQLKGGWSSNSHIWSLINDYAEIETFLNGNFIIYDRFSEYQELTDTFIEGLIISHSMNENQSSRLEHFDDWLLLRIVFNGNAERILKLFYRYELKSIKYKPTSKKGNTFIDIVNNHLTNYQNILSAFEKSCEKSNSVFWEKYNSIFCNFMTLVSISDIDSSAINAIAKNLLKYLNETNFINHLSIKYVRLFIIRKGQFIDKNDLYGFLNLFVTNGKFHENDFIESVTAQIKKHHRELILDETTLKELLFIAFDKCKICNHKHSPEFLPSIYNATNSENKQKIKTRIEDELKNQFNSNLYYMSAIYGVFNGEDDFFDLFIESAKPKSKTASFKSVFSGSEDNRLPQVNMLVNLCFKNDIDLSQSKFDAFRIFDDYYLWLLDLENFDYIKFNPKWATEYQTKYYLEQFRKFPIIKEKALEYLKNNSDYMVEKLIIELSIEISEAD